MTKDNSNSLIKLVTNRVFGKGIVKIFPCLVENLKKYSQKYCIYRIDFFFQHCPPKLSHLSQEIVTFSWEGNVFPYKRPNYPYRHPLPAECHPPLPAVKCLFGNVQNITEIQFVYQTL